MTFTTESKRGSDCSGSDGAANRVLTLSNIKVTLAGGFSVFVNGVNLVPTTEYTVVHNDSASTITFLNVVFNSDYIVVTYLQEGEIATSSSYCSSANVYARTGLSTTEVSEAIVDVLIADAEAELESVCGRKFTSANAVTEFLSVRDKDIIDKYQTAVVLSHWPVQSVTECKIVDDDGSAVETFDTLSAAEVLAGTFESEDYWLELGNDSVDNAIKPIGRLVFKSYSLPKGVNNVKVAYTYGYSSVPRMVTELASCLAGVRAWTYFLGGSYDGINSYSVPEQSVNKGDLFARGSKNMDSLNERANVLFDRIGRRSRILFFASGGDR
jgi:hypothetical protein